ncbi:MAG: septal ring lytic transglycosylase RlpA family protein [Alphaproteobacteria bacterium]|nr:septal ring lytic transglycosylase RlpA family protein [Alphaproteobacteria bacterium]
MIKTARPFAALTLLLLLSSCAEAELASHVIKTGGAHQPVAPSSYNTANAGNFKIGKPYKVDGKWYYPKEQYEMTETGIASWYGPGFQGKKTASGETFDTGELTAAHRTLQMPSLVRVTNLDNGKSVIVRVNDRGPFKRGRVIDVSQKAAELLGFKNNGTAKVKLEVLKEESMRLAQIAKSGQTTKGMEVALNQGGGRFPMGTYQSAALEAPINREVGGQSQDYTSVIPGHSRNGAFYPDPVVTEMPVTRTSIFVQAGSFTQQDNAYKLSQQLSSLSNAGVYPATINGQQFYRVRIGPLMRVEEADEILSRVVNAGHPEAIIVVE